MQVYHRIFSGYVSSFFEKNNISSLFDQNKKILLIASVIFSCVAAYYVITRYCFKAEPLNKDKKLEKDLNEVKVDNDKPKLTEQGNEEKLQIEEFKQDKVPVQKEELILPHTTEEQIAAINSHQIEALAKKVLAIAMDRFEVDVENKALAGETYLDTEGKHHQVYWNQYEPSSEFMTTLLPIVVKKITDSFVDPASFLKTGVEFNFVTPKHDGLVDQLNDESLKTKISQEVMRLKQGFRLNTVAFDITLKLNKKYTDEKSELYFDFHSRINGGMVGHKGGDLEWAEKSALQSTV